MSRIAELERRVQQDPASIVFGALAEEYRRAGRLEEAVATCEQGLTRHPSYLSARVTLGRALQELGRVDEARAEFERVIDVAPDNLAAIRALSELQAPSQAAPHASQSTPQPASAEPSVAASVPSAPAPPAPSALPALERWLAALERERARVTERL